MCAHERLIKRCHLEYIVSNWRRSPFQFISAIIIAYFYAFYKDELFLDLYKKKLSPIGVHFLLIFLSHEQLKLN